MQRLNENFISILGELNDSMLLQGEPFRARAYGKAQETVMMFSGDITQPEQLKDQPGIGPTILSKLKEFVDTGTIQAIEKERKNPLNILAKVYGVGPKKAKELVDTHGITSIDQLRKVKDQVLNDKQKTGLAYFEEIEQRIPRQEIDEYMAVFNKAIPIGSSFEIVGSYRRGATDSGDIDVILTNKNTTNVNNDNTAFIQFVDALIKNKTIIEVLSRGNSKSMTIARLVSDSVLNTARTARRVDFMYSPPDEYAFAILYFTGSKIFNTVQRQRALNQGYTLNEHGIYHMVDGKKGDKVVTAIFPNEKSIFDFLKMEYRAPNERIDGRAVMDKVEQKKPKNTTLKNKKKLKLKIVDSDRTEAELSALIRAANNAYYGNNEPLMSDNEYDILIDYTKTHYPDNAAAKEGHTGSTPESFITRGGTPLPYQMWSMDKIKPDTNALTKWTKHFKGPYVVSCKVDGVSGLYTTEGPAPKLYTRGDGIIGQDVSHIIPYLKLPTQKNITVRGEFIIKKELFQHKYATTFANPRNFVAGVINKKTIDADKYRDLSFVIYEVIHPQMKPSEQLKYLATLEKDIEIIQYSIFAGGSAPSNSACGRGQGGSAPSNELLSTMLMEWRANYAYEIDGLICMNDQIYPRPTGNPDYAFAFKMVLSDQVAEAKVVDVIWTPSKDGYLKPRVQIEPITLGGVTIEYATGFNASFIESNKIGVGALIKLIRSGDVIPHITDVIQAADAPLMPDPTTTAYEWNDTHVDIVLIDKADNQTVKEKNITGFFTHLNVEGLAMGNVKRIIAAGYDTVPKIIAMTVDDLLTVEGFKQKMADKIHENIKTKVKEASLPELMHASNLFGRGFGVKKLVLILTHYPTILEQQQSNRQEKINKVSQIPGMAKKTAENVVDNSDEFIQFMKEAKLAHKLKETLPIASTSIDTSHPLYKKKYIMTGFRDKDLITKLEAVGAEQASSVSKNTFMVIVKTVDETTGKVDEAKKLNIPILTPQMVLEKYFN